ncbi:ABC transporter permease [Mycobacterium sp. MS1601]|uniref:ABC transporter ATP-binding protein n=1 Tax=Mycobacterium sp. MS1601 TaxID=1936029 RepID=UPI0009797BFE|nr:ABC transporter ATP-binding protein [Mycobacterium sp. MS1601]AQA05525.1 ABC transporter permease [Mycobacterium sp. MS1601]
MSRAEPSALTGARVLRRTVVRNLRWLAPGSGLIAAHQLCEVAVPVLIGVIVDRAVATGSVGAIVGWIGALAALFLVLTTVYRFGARLLMFAIARESHLLRIELSRKIVDPLGIRTDYQVGELLSISSTDADETSYVLDYVPRVTGAVVATVACGVVLLTVDLALGLMVLIGVPIVVAGLQLTAPLIARRVEEQQSQIGRTAALATDLVSGHRPLAGIGAQGNAAARYRVASGRALTAALRAARIQSVHAGAAAAAGAVAAMSVAVAAAYFAVQGDLTVGQLITVIGLAQFLIEPFSLLAIVPSWVAEARASANRVATVLSADTRHRSHSDPGADIDEPVGSLSLSGEPALSVGPGELVAVVTADPKDASLLVDTLSGQIRDAGVVRVGGRWIGNIPAGERHRLLLVDHHNSDLFSGTLQSNLGSVPDDDIVQAALTASCAVDVVGLHTDGLAHPVTERGANLSGGQRQRWTLARALVTDPDVLVLHDPTTAVDAVTEQAIADGLRRLRRDAGRTTVVFTTSPALLAAADRVVLIADGHVRAQGAHHRLMETDADYRELVSR